MDEVDAGQTGTPPAPTPRSAGETLRAAREAQGLTLAEIGARTRVPLRHLEAIEAGDYRSLPSPTYAVGFGRAYARAVGLDDVAIARGVRTEVDRLGRRVPEYAPYEVADPSRVPSRGLAIVAAGLALGLLVLAALWFGGTWLQRAPEPEASPVVAARPVPAPTRATAATGGEVVLTAQDEVWLRVYDAEDKTLYLGTMKPGERYVVPRDAADPKINVGRPDKLAVTLNGAAVPPLGTGERPIKDVRVGGAAIAARLSGPPAPAPSASPDASQGAPPAPVAGADGDALPPAFASPAPRPAPRRTEAQRPRRALTETQRANLESARNLRRTAARRER
jgi:transcriptional regulator with XRE-family HTH domain